ncbi:MAG: hypothetical protein PHU21_07445, partial [Elusimicrobia bacterium]|nr:hypothetical protein [Elusimicrobiota bacterium]
STQQVNIITDPPGADCTVDRFTIRSPGVVQLSRRNQSYEVTCTLAGHGSGKYTIGSFTSNWVGGNIVTGFFPGWLVDIISGAHGVLEPDVVKIALQTQ